jgi:DNA repair protein RecO (recombination protein O)
MIEWQDDAVVLQARPHGESALVLIALTRDHGRHAGLVHGGQSQRQRALYQPGNRLRAVWRARLADNLGSFACEPERAYGAAFLGDRERLAGIAAAASVCDQALPEREPHPACFDGLLALLESLSGPFWAEAYVRWELGLLGELGFGLDLERCAVTGTAEDLAWVSPRSGRAVCQEAAAPYRDRLLALPGFLAGRGAGGPAEVAEGLALTGYFLGRHVFHPHNRDLPAARLRFAERQRALAGRAPAEREETGPS